MSLHLGLEQYLSLALYAAGVAAVVLSIFWRPVIGIYYLVPLIPLQTTRYRMMEFPLGASVVNIIFLGVVLGLLRRRQWILPRTPWSLVLLVYALYTLASLFLDLDNVWPRLSEWWNFILMPLLLLLVTAAVQDVRQMKIILLLMCLAVFAMDKSFWNAVSDRDYSTFTRDLQEDGAMGYAGVQGMAAFNAQFCWFLAAMAPAQKTRLLRYACAGLALFAANCVMYSFSRGGYVAFLAGWIFIGLMKQRKLLLLLALFGMTWVSLVPNAVRERVTTTYDPNSGELDRSAELRLELWQDAMNLVQSNLLFGTGYNTYAYMKRLYNYGDTHNIYVKVLVETGVVGLGLLLWLLAKTFHLGYHLFRHSHDSFLSALGLGLAAWIVCTATASLFGDRWTYFQINGYLWVIAGFVARGFMIEAKRAADGQHPEEKSLPAGAAVVPA